MSKSLFSSISKKPILRKPIFRYESSILRKVSELDWNNPLTLFVKRSGIIYYTIKYGEVYLCFGKDKQTGELTDFGGGRRINETSIQCAVREGNEESRFVFGNLTPEAVFNYWCLYNKNMLIVFVYVACIDDDIFRVTTENFNSGALIPNQYKHVDNGKVMLNKCCDEISEIVWLSAREFNNILLNLSTIKFYTRVLKFIRSCPNFYPNILSSNVSFQEIQKS